MDVADKKPVADKNFQPNLLSRQQNAPIQSKFPFPASPLTIYTPPPPPPNPNPSFPKSHQISPPLRVFPWGGTGCCCWLPRAPLPRRRHHRAAASCRRARLGWGLLLGLRGAGAADAGAHLARHLPDHGDGSSRAIALCGASAAAALHVIMFLRPAVARATWESLWSAPLPSLPLRMDLRISCTNCFLMSAGLIGFCSVHRFNSCFISELIWLPIWKWRGIPFFEGVVFDEIPIQPFP